LNWRIVVKRFRLLTKDNYFAQHMQSGLTVAAEVTASPAEVCSASTKMRTAAAESHSPKIACPLEVLGPHLATPRHLLLTVEAAHRLGPGVVDGSPATVAPLLPLPLRPSLVNIPFPIGENVVAPGGSQIVASREPTPVCEPAGNNPLPAPVNIIVVAHVHMSICIDRGVLAIISATPI
jgi:hypothetical protein